MQSRDFQIPGSNGSKHGLLLQNLGDCEPLHGHIASVILPLKCQRPPPQVGPTYKQTHRVPPSITGSWQVRAGRHLRHCLIHPFIQLPQQWLTVVFLTPSVFYFQSKNVEAPPKIDRRSTGVDVMGAGALLQCQ